MMMKKNKMKNIYNFNKLDKNKKIKVNNTQNCQKLNQSTKRKGKLNYQLLLVLRFKNVFQNQDQNYTKKLFNSLDKN